LQDILRDLLGGGGQGGNMNRMVGESGGQGGAATPGNVLDVLKQVLGQATSGVREGAGRLDEATGASQRARDAIGQATGQSPDELIARLKDLIANNQLGAGAALGGLGALILGTGAGRALAGSAARLGGLALIGGLAYKAYQNYQQGLPPLTGGKTPPRQGLLAAPSGSGFEPDAVTHDSALLYVRAMIAAAAADGRIDAAEQQKILGGLQQAGLNESAQQFPAKRSTIPPPSSSSQPTSARRSRPFRSIRPPALPWTSRMRRSTSFSPALPKRWASTKGLLPRWTLRPGPPHRPGPGLSIGESLLRGLPILRGLANAVDGKCFT
jgi:uncharacterized membrane protein YebE (DUF533 family)